MITWRIILKYEIQEIMRLNNLNFDRIIKKCHRWQWRSKIGRREQKGNIKSKTPLEIKMFTCTTGWVPPFCKEIFRRNLGPSLEQKKKRKNLIFVWLKCKISKQKWKIEIEKYNRYL